MLEFVEHTPASLFQVKFYFMPLHAFRERNAAVQVRGFDKALKCRGQSLAKAITSLSSKNPVP